MLTGTGKLYWRIDPLRPDPTFGYIRAVAKNPATGKGYAINVTDEDPKLVLDGIDLTVPHDGTPVEFTAGKVPSHEVYYAIRVAQPPAAGAAPAAVAAGSKTGTIVLMSKEGLKFGRIHPDGTAANVRKNFTPPDCAPGVDFMDLNEGDDVQFDDPRPMNVRPR